MYSERFRTLVTRPDAAAVAQLYASDALLDANVPVWRFQRKGLDEIAGQYDDWYAEGPAEVVGIREWPAPWGSVIEIDQRTIEDGRPVYSRNLHAFFAQDGKVVKHIMYCSGTWDAETEARQKIEAPMYEP